MIKIDNMIRPSPLSSLRSSLANKYNTTVDELNILAVEQTDTVSV